MLYLSSGSFIQEITAGDGTIERIGPCRGPSSPEKDQDGFLGTLAIFQIKIFKLI